MHTLCLRLHASMRFFLCMFPCIGGRRVLQRHYACMYVAEISSLSVQEYYLSVLLAPRPGRATNIMAFNSDVDLAKLESNGSDTDGQLKKPASFSTQIYNSLVSL